MLSRVLTLSVLLLSSCSVKGPIGDTGPAGPAGIAGARGADGANGLDSIQEHSGSRLKRVYLNGSDGSKWAGGWYDSMLKQDCDLLLLLDGSQRCIPTAAFKTNSQLYWDAACSQRFFYLGNVLPPYVVATNTGPTVEVFAVNPTPDTPGMRDYYSTVTGACAKASNQVPGTAPSGYVYAAATEVPPDTFVGVTRSVDDAL